MEERVMPIIVKKWGNSAGIRIPAPVLEAAKITLDGLKSLGLIAGNRGLAVFKASSVILGVFV